METVSGLDGLGWPNPENEPKPETMNDTPETDAESNNGSLCDQCVPVDFARKLERERDEARERADTMFAKHANILDEARNKRDEARGQRDKAWQKIENQAERITYLEGATNHATGTPLSKAIEQRDAVTLRLGETQERMIDAEMQRDRLIKSVEPLKYWRDISECDCSNPLPQGGCLRCDLNRILKTTNPNEL